MVLDAEMQKVREIKNASKKERAREKSPTSLALEKRKVIFWCFPFPSTSTSLCRLKKSNHSDEQEKEEIDQIALVIIQKMKREKRVILVVAFVKSLRWKKK